MKTEKLVKEPKKDKATKETKLDAKNKETIQQVAVKKFIGLDYEKSTAKEQKRFRAEKRRKLFKIVNDYLSAKLSKKLDATIEKESFESFKAFVKENYNIPLSEAENIFKGTNERKNDFDAYIIDFKAYLTNNKKAKAE